MAVINRLNPQTRQLIRLWHNLIRALHFDFRENKNINIYISSGWRQTYCIKYDPSLSTSCVLSSSQKLPIMTLFTILLLLLIDEKGSYTLLFLLSWSRLITNSQCSRLGLLVNHCFSFTMITQTLLFNWIIQIVPYQSFLANVKNIRELLIESWRASFSQSVVLYQGKTMSQVSNLDNISCDLQETARSWIMSSYFLLSRWPIFISV